MGAGNVFQIVVVSFIAVLLSFLFIGLLMAAIDFCCGTNLMRKKRTIYTAPTIVSNTTSMHTHANSTTFTTQRDVDFNLPMCDPLRAYPMPAPEQRTVPPNAGAYSVSINEHEHTSQRARESLSTPFVPLFGRETEDLPPSYEEAVSKTKAGSYY